jgi:hypothetical protein
VEQRRGELLDRFVRLFNQADRNPLTEATQAWLSKFINGSKDQPGSLGWKIIDKLNGIAKDVDELKRQAASARRRRSRSFRPWLCAARKTKLSWCA